MTTPVFMRVLLVLSFEPTDDVPRLIPEWLAGGQHVLDPGHGLLLVTEFEEGGPLQVQEVLFCSRRARWYIAPADHMGERAGEILVVFADVAAATHAVGRHLERGDAVPARHLDGGR